MYLSYNNMKLPSCMNIIIVLFIFWSSLISATSIKWIQNKYDWNITRNMSNRILEMIPRNQGFTLHFQHNAMVRIVSNVVYCHRFKINTWMNKLDTFINVITLNIANWRGLFRVNNFETMMNMTVCAITLNRNIENVQMILV